MILNALNEVGGSDYLAAQAEANPVAFMALIGRCLPKDVRVGGVDKITIKLIGREQKTP